MLWSCQWSIYLMYYNRLYDNIKQNKTQKKHCISVKWCSVSHTYMHRKTVIQHISIEQYNFFFVFCFISVLDSFMAYLFNYLLLGIIKQIIHLYHWTLCIIQILADTIAFLLRPIHYYIFININNQYDGCASKLLFRAYRYVR